MTELELLTSSAEHDFYAPPPGVLLADHYHKPFGYVRHRHSGTGDWLLFYTLSGEGCFKVHEEVYTCKQHDITLFPPNTSHHYATCAGSSWEFMWVHFLPLPYWYEWLQLPKNDDNVIHFRIDNTLMNERIESAFRRLIVDSKGQGKFYEDLALNALSEILIIVKNQTSGEAVKLDPRINEILDYINQNLAKPHILAELAEMAGISTSRLCHLFKEQVGETIINTISAARLKKAAILLEYTSLKIAEISEEVGFSTPYYFTRQFTAHFKTSPTNYRNFSRKKWQSK